MFITVNKSIILVMYSVKFDGVPWFLISEFCDCRRRRRRRWSLQRRRRPLRLTWSLTSLSPQKFSTPSYPPGGTKNHSSE